MLPSLVFRPKKKRFTVVRRPTAQQSPYPRLLSAPYVDSALAPTPTSQQPLFYVAEAAVTPERWGVGWRRPYSADIHIQAFGGFPLPPGLLELWLEPENLFLISCTFAVK